MPRSLRVRLTLGFVLLGSALVVGAALGVGTLVRLAVWRPLDATLDEEAVALGILLRTSEQASGTSAEARTSQLTQAVTQIATEHDLGPAKFVVIRDRDGHTLVSHGRVPRALPPTIGGDEDSARWSFVKEGTARYRTVQHPLGDGRSVAIGFRADHHLQSIARADTALAVGALLFVIVLGALAWRITTRATAEIDAIAAELEALEAHSLDRRVAPRDAIEVDRLAAALNRMLARLEQAVSHLRRFTADAAHELRTPIAALRARLDATLARPASVETYRNGLLDGLEQADRLARLAEDLLTLSAVESAEQIPVGDVDMATVTREVASFLEPVADEQQRSLTIETTPGCVVAGSEKLLKRLLLNLLDNAFRHTPAGTGITVGVERENGFVRVAIRDCGPGIAPSDAALLFRRFGRSSSEHAGFGLGLALCREIARRHDGRIDLSSAPGAGTEVVVELPARAEPPDGAPDATPGAR